MESSNIIFLYQLISAYEQSYAAMEEAYNSQNKIQFDEAKAKILEIQKKIDGVLA